MKGRNPTKEQVRFHSALVNTVGCIACRRIGFLTHLCSIHHMDGRTKPDAHWLVLPLCGEHHQIGQYGPARHKNKTEFESTFGTELALLANCKRLLAEAGYTGRMGP